MSRFIQGRAKGLFTDDDDRILYGSQPSSPHNMYNREDPCPLLSPQSEEEKSPVTYFSKNMKDRPPCYQPTQKYSDEEGSGYWHRTTQYTSKPRKGYSSDDSLSTTSVDRGGGRPRSVSGQQRRGNGYKHASAVSSRVSSASSREVKVTRSGDGGRTACTENVADIYAELQMINAKIKSEFKILHERDKVLKERERALTEAELAVAATKANLDLTVQLEVKRRVSAKEQEYHAEIERVDQVLKEKAKENKRLKDNFDTLKVANDTLRRELESLEIVHGKMEKQATSLQARLTNLQRKTEHDQRRDQTDFLPPELGKLVKGSQGKDGQKGSKTQISKPNAGSYEVLAILLEWISDIHLRHMITDQPTKPLDTLCSSQAVQNKCLKVLPSLAEIIKEVPSTHPALVIPSLQFIYWSLLHLDATHGQGGGAVKMNLSSTLRRLGEELYKSRMVRFAEDETGTIVPPSEKARDKEGVFFRSPNLHIRLLSSLVILRSLNQVDHLAHVFEVLKTDLKNNTAKQLFLHYQATSILIPFLRPTNKALLQAAVDVHLGMAMESPVLSAFLGACSSDTWFRAIAMVMRMPNVDEKIIEKLSILLQKLSKLKTNRRYFEVFGLTLATQELHRTAAGSNNAFLTLNLKSILFNLNAKSTLSVPVI